MVFSLGLAAMTLTVNNLSAQNGGGLFGRGETEAGNRAGTSSVCGIANDGFGGETNGIINDGFGGESPIGGGLLVMTAAVAGYAVLRRKKPEQNKQIKN